MRKVTPHKCVHINAGCQTSLTMLFNVQNDPDPRGKYIPKWKIQAKKEQIVLLSDSLGHFKMTRKMSHNISRHLET